jgi:hypothetical protein
MVAAYEKGNHWPAGVETKRGVSRREDKGLMIAGWTTGMLLRRAFCFFFFLL